jgi:hypothetical protein
LKNQALFGICNIIVGGAAMQEELKNCLRLERFSLWHKYFAFLDVGDYLADSLFIKHQVTVKFMQEYGREALPCRMIFCRIRKQDESAFLEALRELPDKMLLCGYPDYPARCRDFMEKVEHQKPKERMCSHDADDTAAKTKQA